MSLGKHPLSEKFHGYLREAGELHDAKQEDYGLDSDPFANVRASSEWGIPAWQGAMIRANDKIRRLQTFARKGSLKNESVIDAFMDLAVYAIIGRILYEEEYYAPTTLAPSATMGLGLPGEVIEYHLDRWQDCACAGCSTYRLWRLA